MHKHRPSVRSGNKQRRNANVRLPESVAEQLRGLAEALCAGEDDYFAAVYLKSEYLSKYNDEKICPATQRKANAIAKWKATESQNEVTNQVLRDRDMGWNILPRVTYGSFLKFARKLTADILGPLRDAVVLGGFSGGASTSRRRTESAPAFKFTEKADTTATAAPYLDLVLREAPLLRKYGTFSDLREVEGAVLFTVPKKSDIDRCACKEPDFNMFLQKGVGNHIRRRLRRFGINLNDQSINRRLAQIGARDGSLATIDLSSASDTITIEMVKAFLPTEWFLYLDDIRSHTVYVDGEAHRTAMFSSMGNGFTFELESLLFYVICRATLYFEGIPGVVSVYGDDIIVPSSGYNMVTWALQSFGFKVNPDKSFHTGPFRESCGGHYHHIEDVTPFYLRRRPTRMVDLIRVCNQLRRWALADPARQYMMPATYNLWLKLASYVPRDLWGGWNFDVDTQLAAPVPPNKQLIRLSWDKEVPAHGAYCHWHNSSWQRTQGPEAEAFEPSETNSFCRRGRVRNGIPYHGPLFHQEL
nr:MAG: RNA dependent RNA polymerase [Leviviridae sp.]